ncbi:MAG: alpha/beta hydrolase [Akkermansiaceae bacterium]|jgi:acetyl esterase/lipase
MTLKLSLLSIQLLLITSMTTSAQTIQLWPDGTPGFSKDYVHKPFVQQDPERISEISQPFMRISPADPSKATGHGLLIFPGGGYSILADKKEGDRVAKFFASKGISSFVVCYRVSRKGGEKGYQFPGPLLDARQAMRYVRKNAAKYKIDPSKVGVIGFSAGGHLSSMFGTRYNDQLDGDPVSDISVKPAFTAMIYPVVSAIEPYSHGCTRKILGKNPSDQEKIAISAERLITKDTPPMFLVHNQFDGVKSLNSIALAEAATKAKVHCELHLYPAKEHGFGMGIKGKDLAADWPNLLVKFIKRIK